MDTFTCDRCKQVFQKRWTDEEAKAEFTATFGYQCEIEKEAIVCESCYEEFMAWYRKRN